MIVIQGQGVSKGVAQGRMRFLASSQAVEKRPADPVKEISRLDDALRAAAEQLLALANRCRAQAGEDMALLFETHAMLAGDEDFRAAILDVLEGEKCCAEYAVQTAGEQLAGQFAGMEDSYMQARSADIRDVAGRVARILTGASEETANFDSPVILAADDLAPSETVRLDKRMILAFATRYGSVGSHTAILARAMGIPAVCGLGDELKKYDGQTVHVDGEAGQLILDPDESTRARLAEKLHRTQEQLRILSAQRGKADETLDGRRMDICCNIGSPQDVQAVLENDGHGVGLFRSEFLYMSQRELPDEETQFQAYKSVAEAMQGKRVVIRTLDLGADKQADYLPVRREENPALGLRGVRLCLSRPEILLPQLRALYRASAYGRIAILFPMITSLWEVRECRRLCGQVMVQLDGENIPYNRHTELGAMIETPASALIADALAKEADFFSIGTNDLSQYILACDRQAGGLERFFDPHHPAVLRAVKRVADAAHDAGIWVGVCGELASDLTLLPTFLAMGIDELSVSPSQVLPLRREIRRTIARNCTLEKLEP